MLSYLHSSVCRAAWGAGGACERKGRLVDCPGIGRKVFKGLFAHAVTPGS